MIKGPAMTTSTASPIAISVHSLSSQLDSHSLQITQQRLNGTNYREWSQSVLLVIKGRGKLDYITWTIPAAPVDSAIFSSWDVENSIMMAWLVNSGVECRMNLSLPQNY